MPVHCPERISNCVRLDYPGIGPEHSALKDWGRAEYFSATDKDALEAFQLLSKTEGIIPALETSHALAHLKASLLQIDFVPPLPPRGGVRPVC